MATLNSPGVSVSVIDESFYTPASPGTVPLIFVASAADKSNASGTGTAPGTLAANAGKVWTITSQRDLTDTFGTPVFYTDASGNPVHGGELNEYGLQAAYSLLGVSSKAYIARADVDGYEAASSSSGSLWDGMIAVGATFLATGVLVGGRVSAEDAYAYSKFTRIVLGSNDITLAIDAANCYYTINCVWRNRQYYADRKWRKSMVNVNHNWI